MIDTDTEIVLGNTIDDVATTITIGCVTTLGFAITVRVDGIPQGLEFLTFKTTAARDEGLERLTTGLVGDGYVLLT